MNPMAMDELDKLLRDSETEDRDIELWWAGYEQGHKDGRGTANASRDKQTDSKLPSAGSFG